MVLERYKEVPVTEFVDDQNPAVTTVHILNGPGYTMCRRPGSLGRPSIAYAAPVCLWCIEAELVRELDRVRAQIKDKENESR